MTERSSLVWICFFSLVPLACAAHGTVAVDGTESGGAGGGGGAASASMGGGSTSLGVGGGGLGGGPAEKCAQQIYLIGQDTGMAPDPAQPVVLYAFDPAKPAMHRVGPIPCISASEMFVKTAAACAPASGGGCSTAMMVDDKNIAWISTPFIEGAGAQKLYAVNTKDATCTGTSFTVSAPGYGVTGAAFVPKNVSTSEPAHYYVAVQNGSSPSGLMTVGDLDTSTGAVQNIRPVNTPKNNTPGNPRWYASGNISSSPVSTWLLFVDWPTKNYPNALLYIDPSCKAGACDNAAPDGSAAPEGTATWQMAQADTAASQSAAWTAVWASYNVAVQADGKYYYDLYFFTPGWWSSGHERNVVQLNLDGKNGAYGLVSNVMPDLGANAFAATAGPACPPVDTPPPLPPVN